MKKLFLLLLLAVTFMATAQVANDDCSNATLLTVSGLTCTSPVNGTLAGSIVMATPATVCEYTTTKDVWYEFTATSQQHYVTLNNVTSGADIRMALYGTCNSNAIICGTSALYTSNLAIGQSYKIRVFSKGTGSVSLNANFSICVKTPVTPVSVSVTQYTTEQLVNNVLVSGECVTPTYISSITGTNFGSVNGIGYFNNINNNNGFPFNEGIILSSGNALTNPLMIPSPDSQSWIGDTDISTIMTSIGGTGASRNATILEFEFIPAEDHISLEYIFASNEYGNFQCNYGDAIAILLTDLTTGVTKNIATVPNTATPVATTSIRNLVNNPNCVSVNPQYFGNYSEDLTNPIAYKGRTVPLIAESDVTVFANYHLKIVVADRYDTSYDSAIFINAGSLILGTYNQPVVITASNGTVLCGEESTVLSVEANEGNDVEWAFNGATVIAPNFSSLTASQPGEYTATVSHFGLGCGITESITITEGISVPQQLQVTDYIVTDNDNDGFASFDLSVKTAEISNQLTGNYDITYYETLADAENKTNAISALLYTNISNPQVLYARIEKPENGCPAIRQFSLTLQPVIPAPTGATNQTFYNGETLADLEVTGENIQWYADSSTTEVLPATTPLVDGNTYYASQTINNTESTERLAVTASLIIISPPTGASEQTFYNGETLADLEVTGENIQWYADSSATEVLPATTLLVDGNTYYASQTINNTESTERLAVTVSLVTISAPTGDSDQTFTEGDTLADIELDGENIQWYDNSGEGPVFPDGSSLPLPLTTVLTDGTTYYASQTINGVESTERLAVTAHLILGNDDIVFEGMRFYPNPVNNVLNIENTNDIDTVSIANALGQKVFSKTVNNTAAQIDMASLSKGIYFVTVTSGSASKTIKVIKE